MLEFNMLALVLCCNWLVAHGPPAVFVVVKCTLMDPGPLGWLEILKAVRFGRCIYGAVSFCTCLEFLHMCMYIFIYVYL